MEQKTGQVTASTSSQTGNADFCFVASSENSKTFVKWYLDSGATEHLVSDSNLLNFKRFY